jgi:hypothetical protein
VNTERAAQLAFLRPLFKAHPGAERWATAHIEALLTAPGSVSGGVARPGGYVDHLRQLFGLVDFMYATVSAAYGALPFDLSSVHKVLFFSTVEKVVGRGPGAPAGTGFDRETYLNRTLAGYDVTFTMAEVNALTYARGEGPAYRSDRRVMNELAGFCHACDVLLARTLYDRAVPATGPDRSDVPPVDLRKLTRSTSGVESSFLVDGRRYSTHTSYYVGSGAQTSVYVTPKYQFWERHYGHRGHPGSATLITAEGAKRLLSENDYETAHKLWPDEFPAVVDG